MGNFFTSTQIFNNKKLSKDQFVDKFCKKMAEGGYVACNSDESELSYILRFADGCDWVTITSEAYEQGNQTSQKDTGRIAKMLGTNCVNTVVIDSDCAIMVLYDEKGKKADTLILGRADDYFGDDIPQPSEKIWKPFLSMDGTWERFIEICSKDEVFVEDSLSELAPIIGMDSSNILFSADDAEKDENTFTLGFAKRAIKEKKLSLNAAFKSVYGELLEPKGFKLLKSKYPYLIRVIDDEVIQIISFMKEKAFDHKYEGFSLCISLNILERHLIEFDKNPSTISNQSCMMPLISFSHNYLLNIKAKNNAHKKFSFYYTKGNSEEMRDALKQSQKELMPFVLEVFEKNKTLDDLYQLGYSVLPGLHKDVVILTHNVDEFLAHREKVFPDEFQRMVKALESNPFMQSMVEKKKSEAIEKNNSFNQWFADRSPGKEEYESYMKEKLTIKSNNINLLKNLGITFKKEIYNI